MKKYFRIALKGAHPTMFFDMEVGQDLRLPMWWANVAMSGAVVTENFCVPYDQIAHVSVVTVEQVQQGWKPQVVS